MVQSSKPHLSYEAQVRLPDPIEALNIAHAVHASEDPLAEGGQTDLLAKQIAERFHALKPRRNDMVETAYLEDAVKPAVHSYSRGIKQAKSAWRDRLQEAVEIRADQEARLNSGFLSSQGVGIVWVAIRPLIFPALFAFVAFVLFKFIGLYVPEELAQKTGPNWVAIGGSVFAGIFGRVVSVRLRMDARDRIRKEYDKRKSAAREAYYLSKRLIYEASYKILCKAWRQYTGKPYKKTGMDFKDVMEGDRAYEEMLETFLADFEKPWHARAKETIRHLRDSIGELRQKKITEADAPPTNTSKAR